MAILREIEANQREVATTWKRQLEVRKWAVEKAIECLPSASLAGAVYARDDVVAMARKIENYVMGRTVDG